jgi:hypothetical protein
VGSDSQSGSNHAKKSAIRLRITGTIFALARSYVPSHRPAHPNSIDPRWYVRVKHKTPSHPFVHPSIPFTEIGAPLLPIIDRPILLLGDNDVATKTALGTVSSAKTKHYKNSRRKSVRASHRDSSLQVRAKCGICARKHSHSPAMVRLFTYLVQFICYVCFALVRCIVISNFNTVMVKQKTSRVAACNCSTASVDARPQTLIGSTYGPPPPRTQTMRARLYRCHNFTLAQASGSLLNWSSGVRFSNKLINYLFKR